MKALKFDEDGPNIKLSDFENHYILVFDLTSTQEAQIQMYYPDVVAGSLRLELNILAPITNTLELILLGERLSTVYINKDGRVVKNG